MPLAVGGGREQAGGDGGHTGGERDRGPRVLQPGQRLLEAGGRGVPQPLVDVAAAGRRSAAAGQGLVAVAAEADLRQRVGRGQVDRRDVGAGGGQRGPAGGDGGGG